MEKTKRITVELDEKSHRKLKEEAARRGITIKQIVITLLRKFLGVGKDED